MGTNINGINQTNIILISIKRNYSVFSWFHLHKFVSVLLARNLIGKTKHRCFLMRGLWSSFCKNHSWRTIYHSNMEWVPYQIKLSHKSTSWIPTVNQSLSQQPAWHSNCPRVHRLYPIFKTITLLCCSVFLCCKN